MTQPPGRSALSCYPTSGPQGLLFALFSASFSESSESIRNYSNYQRNVFRGSDDTATSAKCKDEESELVHDVVSEPLTPKAL